MKVGVPFISRVLASPLAKKSQDKKPKEPINFNDVAAIEKGEDPNQLSGETFEIDSDNRVILWKCF